MTFHTGSLRLVEKKVSQLRLGVGGHRSVYKSVTLFRTQNVGETLS